MDGSWKSGERVGRLQFGHAEPRRLWPGRRRLTRRPRPTLPRPRSPAGELHPFTGPLNKQDGTPFLKAGEKIADKDLAGMNFYVQGIDGALPK